MSEDRPTILLVEASQERHTLVTWLVGDLVHVSADPAVLTTRAGQSKIVLVDLADNLERALQTIEDLRASVPKAQIVALADRKDPDLILRAMRAGAREFAVPDEGTEFTSILTTLLRRAAAEVPAGRIISVFPAKGGVGATTLATNLAAALAGIDKRVLLVDLDRHLGDVLVFLDLAPRYSIADVVENLHRLDRDLLASSLGRHSSGIFVLPMPDSLEDGKTVTAAQVPQWLPFLAQHFDFVLCDGLRGYDELSIAILDASSRIELLFTQDVVALKNTKRCLDVFHRLNYSRSKVDLVVNRFHKKSPIDLASMSDSLGLDVHTTLANDHPSAVAALNRGVPLREAAPRSKLTQDIAELAAQIAGTPPEKRTGPFSSLFRRASPAPAEPEPASDATKEGSYGVARRTPEAS